MANYFLKNASALDELGVLNPATYVFLKDLMSYSSYSRIQVPFIGIIAIYVFAVFFIIWASVLGWRKLQNFEAEERLITSILLLCLTYALVLPRFKDYSYILLIVPVYYIIKYANFEKSFWPLFMVVILYPNALYDFELHHIPVISNMFIFIFTYYPLWIAYGAWGMYLYYISQREKKLTDNPVNEKILEEQTI